MKYQVILASGSPRRKELLELIGVEFNIITSNKEEVIKAVGKYIYAETSDVSVYGTLLSVNEDILNIEYLAKNIKKKIDINYNDIKLIRLAIKF